MITEAAVHARAEADIAVRGRRFSAEPLRPEHFGVGIQVRVSMQMAYRNDDGGGAAWEEVLAESVGFAYLARIDEIAERLVSPNPFSISISRQRKSLSRRASTMPRRTPPAHRRGNPLRFVVGRSALADIADVLRLRSRSRSGVACPVLASPPEPVGALVTPISRHTRGQHAAQHQRRSPR